MKEVSPTACFSCRNYIPGLKDISRGQCNDLAIPVRADFGVDCPYFRRFGAVGGGKK
jgi:hypothetical protein